MERLYVVVPSVFVEAPPKTPELLPIPGNVTLADLLPKPVEYPAFLQPWKPLKLRPQHPVGHPEEGAESIAVEVVPSMYSKYLAAYDVEQALHVVFRHCPDEVPRIMASLHSPFRGGHEEDGVVWTHLQRVGRCQSWSDKLGGKKLKERHRYFTKGPPWSVFSVGVEGGGIRKNYIYDGDGNVCAEVDFGCGANPSVHYHPLITGNMQHSAVTDEHHCLPWYVAPWFWLIFPDLRRTGAKVEHGFGEWGPPNSVTEVQNGTFQWLAVSLTYEDLLGERQFSDEWDT
jgi:hypothetical protein